MSLIGEPTDRKYVRKVPKAFEKALVGERSEEYDVERQQTAFFRRFGK